MFSFHCQYENYTDRQSTICMYQFNAIPKHLMSLCIFVLSFFVLSSHWLRLALCSRESKMLYVVTYSSLLISAPFKPTYPTQQARAVIYTNGWDDWRVSSYFLTSALLGDLTQNRGCTRRSWIFAYFPLTDDDHYHRFHEVRIYGSKGNNSGWCWLCAFCT